MLRAPRARATSSARAIMRAPIPRERKAAATWTLPTRGAQGALPRQGRDEGELEGADDAAVALRHVEGVVAAVADRREGGLVGGAAVGRPAVAVAAERVRLVEPDDGLEVLRPRLADDDLAHAAARFACGRI
jgi:hypothetical protein